jgi:hypothetical protein
MQPLPPAPIGTTPDGVVDGMEVFHDVPRCLTRARELSVVAGFVADMSRSYNEGFYKIDPSQGLCDIHFVAQLGDPIQDHDGFASVLNHQVALYCPCNGGWAVNESW